MQVNKFVVIGAIGLVSIGAIAFLNNVKYQEEKKAARQEAKAAEVSCIMYSTSLSSVKIWEKEAKQNPNDEKNKERLKTAKESADESKKACEKIEEYKNKYER